MSGWRFWNGEQVTALVKQACEKAVDKTAHVVLTASKEEVPLDESPLMRSGIVLMKWRGSNPVAVICYGGGAGTGFPKLPYAVKWHENDANFQHGRKKNYLRDPYNRLASSTLRNALMEELRAVL